MRDERRVYFRWVGESELADFRACGKLRASNKSSRFGKHVTSSPDLAWKWGYHFGGGGGIVRIEVLEVVDGGVYHIGENLDGIGPAWFLSFEQLDACEVTEQADE